MKVPRVVRYNSERNVRIPVVAKTFGNRQEETWRFFVLLESTW